MAVDFYRAVDGSLHAFNAGDDQKAVHAQLLGAGHGDHVSRDDLNALVPELAQTGLALGAAADGAHLEIVLHNVPKHIRGLGDAGKAHYRQLVGHALSQTDGAQNVIDRGDDVAGRDVGAVSPDGLGGAAPGNDGVNVVVPVFQDGTKAILQVAHVDDKLHVAALGSNIGHQVVHSLIGRDAQQTQLLHKRRSFPGFR